MSDTAPTRTFAATLLPPIRLPGPGFRSVRVRPPWRWPRVGTTLAAGLGTLVSLAPGLLPRTPTTQAVLTGLLVAVAFAFAGLIRLVIRRRGNRAGDPTGPRRLILAVAVIAVLAMVIHAGAWQNTLRAAMGVASIGPGYWVRWGVGTALLTGSLMLVVRGSRRLLRWVGWSRVAVTAVVAGLLVAFFGVPALVDWGRGTYAAANASVDPDMVRPATFTRSGSAESMVNWTSLGREGQRFVTSGPSGAVRVYVGLRSAPDLAGRAELAVRELERTGGFDRSHLVIAVPTGSGWVDARALEGFGMRFGGDVAVVALQYSYAPSWATFIFGRRAAAVSAQALFTAVEKYAATLPRPPRLYLYGQSLGALGGSAVFTDPAEQNRRACSVLWAGKPGGGGPEPGARTAVLANISDPVVHWSPGLLWRPPNLSATRRDAPIPRWLPVVSFLQTTADLLGALDAPPGHGHRYGIDQGTVLPPCDRTG
ncbi:alpha/beta-hydrolase family protein [Nocardia brevicatena]|uniref:alpha/beta-hydrolase family protein n=1 Tax=Nocardia brevicatena TaxID=37327 RepID=UPI0003063C9F|nr:alpha/beta-hydrolase family protein [Nocardia brevicatena]